MSHIYHVMIDPDKMGAAIGQFDDILVDNFAIDADARIVSLELSGEPATFKELEAAALQVGYGTEVDLSMRAISELGISLELLYYSNEGEEHKGYVFIPASQIISISTTSKEDIDEWMGKKK